MFSPPPFIAVDVSHKNGKRQKMQTKINIKCIKNPFKCFISRIFLSPYEVCVIFSVLLYLLSVKGGANLMESVRSIAELREIINPIVMAYGAERVYLFGSYARGEATPESDLDFRIEKGRIQSLFQLTGFEMDMEEGFDKPLDVLTTSMLSEQFLRDIKPEEVLIYAAS